MENSGLNKADLIELVADNAKISKAAAARALNTFADAVRDTLAAGGEVNWGGHGTYKTSHRKARTGRNPQTGEVINIAASVAVVFKAGKALKDSVNHK